MRKLVFMTAICALLAAPAFADTVQVYQTGYSSGSGGEFTAVPTNWSWDPLKYYDDSTSNQGGYVGSFQTFCIETAEFFSTGTPYNVTFGSNAMYGQNYPTGDPISRGTAWLYHEFQNQTLDGYEWDDVAGRQASAGALQATIWWLEGEGSDPGAGNIFRQAVVGKFGIAGAMANNNGAYPVLVMSLWQLNGGVAQDMLVCVPIPAAVLLGMLGLGAAGLKLRKFV